MTESLLAISIGPVQPFIAAARKTRDFWCGSVLLSQIARAVATYLHEQGATLIFPAPQLLAGRAGGSGLSGDVEEVDADVANKVLALVPGDPNEVADKAEKAGRGRLGEIARAALQRVPGLDEKIKELALHQIGAVLEFYWAAVPAPAEGYSTTHTSPIEKNRYSQDRALVEQLLAARKNTRNFSQVLIAPDLGRQAKCAIDGQREAIATVPAGERDRTERLCGVCLVKRFGFGATSWANDTTTHFATRPVVAKLKGSQASEAFRRTVTGLAHATAAEVEASYLFEERIRSLLPEPDAGEALKALRTLKDRTRVEITPYYALLRADGDRMGKAISACHDIGTHQRLSERLVVFTQKAKGIVGEHHGRVVYAGGDDVLALLPVKDSVRCAKDLADAFVREVTDQLTFPDAERPTLSVGLVIAHHLDPLTDVIEMSHRAERAAKTHRNALAVLISKRSGSDYLASGPWGTFDESLIDLVEAFQQERLPGGLPHELARIAIHTSGMDADRQAIEEAELTRVLARKRSDKGNTKLDEAAQALVKLDPSAPERETLSSLAKLLGVARELASLSQGGAR